MGNEEFNAEFEGGSTNEELFNVEFDEEINTGGGAVNSVNGQTGDVVLTTSDLENTSGYQTGSEVESAISMAVGAEATAREQADTRLDTAISGLTDALATETTTRTAADANLQSQIDGITASSGEAILLTADDYDYPADSPNAIDIESLAPGIYKIDSTSSVRYHIGTGGFLARHATFIVGDVTNTATSASKWIIFSNSYGSINIKYSNSSTIYTLLDSGKIVDNLISTATSSPLSANQGRILNEKITAIEAKIAVLEGN